MKKALTIAKWEFFEKVKRKSFIASLIITPLIVLLIGLSTGLLMDNPPSAPLPLGILDATGNYGNNIRDRLESNRLEDGQPAYILVSLSRRNVSVDQLKIENDIKVRNRSLRGYIFINKSEKDGLTIELRHCCSIFDKNFNDIERAVREAVLERELADTGLHPDFINRILTESTMN